MPVHPAFPSFPRQYFIAAVILFFAAVLFGWQYFESPTEAVLTHLVIGVVPIILAIRILIGCTQIALDESYNTGVGLLLLSKIFHPMRFMLFGILSIAFMAGSFIFLPLFHTSFLEEHRDMFFVFALPFLVWFLMLECSKRTPQKGLIHADGHGILYYPKDILPKRTTIFTEAMRKIETNVLWSNGQKSLITQYFCLCPPKKGVPGFGNILESARKEAVERIENALNQGGTDSSNILERIASDGFHADESYVWGKMTISDSNA